MHKLKNKHTGEVITTPYMAEVKEYLNSGDYEMTKPVYTKEMQERGELPAVGMELLIHFKGGNTFKGKIKYISNDGFVFEKENGEDSFCGSLDIVGFKPLPTIEDELFDVTTRFIGREITQADLVCELLEKYNITPKEK